MMEDSISSTDRSENDYSFLTETPLGDRDKHLKIQLCIEYLTKKKESKGKNILKSSNSKTWKQVNVTISNVKNIPRLTEQGRKKGVSIEKNPFVKIRLLPDDVIHTTELIQPKRAGEVQFYETFEFPADDLAGKSVQVQVCADRKVTRGSKALGSVTISLESISLGSPVIQWYELI